MAERRTTKVKFTAGVQQTDPVVAPTNQAEPAAAPTTQSNTLQAAFMSLVNELGAVERDQVARGVVVSLIAAKNVLLLGPPGTAKSMMAQALCQRLTNGRYFQRLLTRFTTPEELFGPLKISQLQHDKFERAITGYLPEAHIAFLDEVFKGSSAILNTLLTLLNEQTFHNGTEAVACPLIMAIGASNEFGEDDVEALYDRFLLRYELSYVADCNVVSLLEFKPAPVGVTYTVEQLQAARTAAKEIVIQKGVLTRLATIRQHLNARGVYPSDRRLCQCLDLLRAWAWLHDEPVTDKHLLKLEDALWTRKEDRAKVSECLVRALSPEVFEAREKVAQARKLYHEIYKERKEESLPLEKLIEIGREFVKKTDPLEKQLDELIARTPPDFIHDVKETRQKLTDMRRSITDAEAK